MQWEHLSKVRDCAFPEIVDPGKIPKVTKMKGDYIYAFYFRWKTMFGFADILHEIIFMHNTLYVTMFFIEQNISSVSKEK